MSQPNFQVRRATVDDLPQLRLLWHAEHLPVADLERRFTEFQVVQGEDGALWGAVGLHIECGQGLVHGETFAHPENEEVLRPFLWERVQSVARNHGLHRLWTKERAPFWLHCGFAHSTAEDLNKLPVAYGGRHGDWFTIKLKEDLHAAVSTEKEFELFQEAERAATERLMRQARFARMVAAGIAVVAFGALLVLGAKLFRAYRARKR